MLNNKKSNVFTKSDIAELYKSINQELLTRATVEWDDSTMGRQHDEKLVRIKRNFLGRLEVNHLPISKAIEEKVYALATEMYQLPESSPEVLSGVTYVEYNPKYGDPVLNVHKDKGTCGLILDYQLESNTSWGFGSNFDIYDLSDNDIIAMYPTTHYHWRPLKSWNSDEFIKLIFFEFVTPGIVAVEDEQLKKEIVKVMYGSKMEDANVL